MKYSLLKVISDEIVQCRICKRLTDYREQVSREKKRAYKDEAYWGKPVPSFGEDSARLLIIGLAPAAHGGNRTGRIFTGDSSGDFLFDALYRFGFSNQPTSFHAKDGLKLIDAYITAVAHCAPPGNKPLPGEIENCRPYLIREMEALTQRRAVLVLGQIAFNEYLKILKASGKIEKERRFKFGHGSRFQLKNLPTLFSSYHPSQQNTRTGKLTRPMFDQVISQIREFIDQ
ncbi:MAG: uracil-DNA glycosylase [Nitrospiria bacterium]